MKKPETDHKTYKRELSLVFSAVLLYQVWIQNEAMVSIIVWPFLSFIAASAGLHIYGGMHRKPPKPPHGGRPQRGSQRPSREDQHPDDWYHK